MNSSVATLAKDDLTQRADRRVPWAPPGVPTSALPPTWPAPTISWLKTPPLTPQEPLRLPMLPASPRGLPIAGLNRRNVLTGIGLSFGAALVVSGCGGSGAVDDLAERAQRSSERPRPKFTPEQNTPSANTGSDTPGGRSGPSPDRFESASADIPSLDSRDARASTPGSTETPAPSPSPAPSGGAPAPTTGGASVPRPAAPSAVVPPAVVPPAVVPPAVVPPAVVPPAVVPPAAPAPGPTPPAPTPPADPTPPPPPPPPGPTAGELAAMHRAALADRIAFAPTPAVVAEVASMGPVAYLEQQLSIPPAGTSGVLTGGHTLDMSIAERFQAYRSMGSDRPAREMRLAAVRRAVQHPGQLAEMMVDFWTNHFSTYSGEDDKNVRYAVATDDVNVIRAHAMGRFADLVVANARSVSMLLYLDNHRSSGNQPNQNYARELMELHVLGEANGYDENDVEFVARILTGWGLTGRLDTDGLAYLYQPNRHFTGAVDVTIAQPDGSTATFSAPARGRDDAAGEQDGINFINWLVRLPNAAQFIATKLVRRFVSDDPPPSLVASTAAVYLANDTQIVPVLRHILTSAEFITARGAKVKSPFELLVGMLRASNAAVDPMWDGPASNTITDRLNGLGHSMWQWPTPDGFPDVGSFWVTTQTTLRRWELAGRAGNGNLNGIAIDVRALIPDPVPATVGELFDAIASRFGITLIQNDRAALGVFVSIAPDTPTATIDLTRFLGDIVGLILSTPAFQYR